MGLALFALGLGNLAMGTQKLEQYRQKMAQAIEIGGPEVAEPYRGTASILVPPSEAHLRYENAAMKYAYYEVVLRGGRMFAVLGVLLIGGALARRVLVPVPEY